MILPRVPTAVPTPESPARPYSHLSHASHARIYVYARARARAIPSRNFFSLAHVTFFHPWEAWDKWDKGFFACFAVGTAVGTRGRFCVTPSALPGFSVSVVSIPCCVGFVRLQGASFTQGERESPCGAAETLWPPPLGAIE